MPPHQANWIIILPLALFFIVLFAYVFQAICLQRIAKKAGIKDDWLAWIPLVNLVLMCRMARLSPWLALFCFIPCIGIIFAFIIYYRTPRCLGVRGPICFLMLPLVVNLVYMGFLAFSFKPTCDENGNIKDAQAQQPSGPAINAAILIAILLVVTLVLGLFASAMLPAFEKVRQTSQQNAVTNNLRRISAAADEYFLTTGATSVTYDKLAEANKSVNAIHAADGEDYRKAFSTIAPNQSIYVIYVPSLNRNVAIDASQAQAPQTTK